MINYYGKPFSHLIRICIYLQLIADICNCNTDIFKSVTDICNSITDISNCLKIKDI